MIEVFISPFFFPETRSDVCHALELCFARKRKNNDNNAESWAFLLNVHFFYKNVVL